MTKFKTLGSLLIFIILTVPFFGPFCVRFIKESSANRNNQYPLYEKYRGCAHLSLGQEIYFGHDFSKFYAEFERNFKVFSYKLSEFAPNLEKIYKHIERLEMMNSSFPSHWRIVQPQKKLPTVNSKGQYALELWVNDWLKRSKFQTLRPEKATAFFVNIPCAALRKLQQKRVPAQRVTQVYVKKLVENIAMNMASSVNGMNFLDHFYVCSHDMGIESIRGAPLNFRTNAIGIVHTADFLGKDAEGSAWNSLEDILPTGQGGLIFNAHRDLTAPPYILSGKEKKYSKTFQKCEFLAMFLGNYGGRPTRSRIFSLFANHSSFLLGSAHGSEYERAFHRSKFCLVVRGLVTSTLRFSEVFLHSCIPVIISDGYIPPFSRSINWRTFSIVIPEDEVVRIPEILGSISEEKWNYLNRNLLQVRKHFLYHDPPIAGDAFHMILYEVWKKIKVWRRAEL